jgi:hypothetical protein
LRRTSAKSPTALDIFDSDVPGNEIAASESLQGGDWFNPVSRSGSKLTD